MAKQKRRGRPGRAVKPGERVSLGLRVTPELKTRLDDAAEKSGRSQSQEAELRLERSFRDQHLLIEALELAYGLPLAGVLLAIGEAMKIAGRECGFMSTLTIEGADNWLSVPYGYKQAANAARQIIDAIEPTGEYLPPQSPYAEDFGVGFANTILAEAASGLSRTGNKSRAEMLHRLFGELSIRISEFDELSERASS